MPRFRLLDTALGVDTKFENTYSRRLPFPKIMSGIPKAKNTNPEMNKPAKRYFILFLISDVNIKNTAIYTSIKLNGSNLVAKASEENAPAKIKSNIFCLSA